MKPALTFALIAAAFVIFAASYTQSNAPGAGFRYAKTSELPWPLVKDQERICPEDATDLTGCAR